MKHLVFGNLQEVEISRSRRWKRNQKLVCYCTGYWFPHRIFSGLCYHNPLWLLGLVEAAKDLGLTNAEVIDLQLEWFDKHPGKKTLPP